MHDCDAHSDCDVHKWCANFTPARPPCVCGRTTQGFYFRLLNKQVVGMISSAGAANTARPSRDCDGDNYQVILPTLPTGNAATNTIVFHGDVGARPYRRDDFKQVLKSVLNPDDIAAFGAYQMNHVWILTTRTAEAKEKLLALKECQVKGRRCLIMDSELTSVQVRVHWVPFNISDDAIRDAFGLYGKVQALQREVWKDDFFKDIETTTRKLQLTLKEGVTVNSIPHVLKIMSNPVLVSISGRPPLCLRCRQVGHVRQQCRVPRCSECRRYGHDKEGCIRSYAERTRVSAASKNDEYIMGDEEMTEVLDEKRGGTMEDEERVDPKTAEGKTTAATNHDDPPACENQTSSEGARSAISWDAPESVNEVQDPVGRDKSDTPDNGGTQNEAIASADKPSKEEGKESTEHNMGSTWKTVANKRWKYAKVNVPYNTRSRGGSQDRSEHGRKS